MQIDSMTSTARDALTTSATGSIKIVAPTVNGATSWAPLSGAIVKINKVPLVEGSEWTAATSAAATATSLAGAITTATATTLCTGAVDEVDTALVIVTANTAGLDGNNIHMTMFSGYTEASDFVLSGGAAPTEGSLIYNTSTSKLDLYTTDWKEVTSA